MKLTIRLKLFAAFALVAALGGSGGVLSLFRLRDLARTYQTEQNEVAVHEAIHDDRIALLSLLNLATRHQGEPEPAFRQLADARMQQLSVSTRLCNECHGHVATHVNIAAQLESLKQSLIPLLNPPSADATAGDPAALRSLETSISALEESLGRMEARYHQLLDRRRESGKTVLQPYLWQQIALVLGGLAVALALAYLVSRALSRPILPLIAAARDIGNGKTGLRTELPRDPDLAQVATALNEMATLVAERAREDVRRQLLERTISSQEEERKRVARELHDELGQSLSALLMEARSQHARGEIGATAASALEPRIQRLLDDVRRMAWDLRPSLLDDLGLHSALGRFAEETSKRYGLSIDFQTVGLDPGHGRLPAPIETVLYRVAQEALNNVTRHASAHRVSLVLVRRREEVALLVEDDGVGFDAQGARRGSGSLGIVGMEERVALVGGSLSIESTPGKGTAVRAEIPLGEAHP